MQGVSFQGLCLPSGEAGEWEPSAVPVQAAVVVFMFQ